MSSWSLRSNGEINNKQINKIHTDGNEAIKRNKAQEKMCQQLAEDSISVVGDDLTAKGTLVHRLEGHDRERQVDI